MRWRKPGGSRPFSKQYRYGKDLVWVGFSSFFDIKKIVEVSKTQCRAIKASGAALYAAALCCFANSKLPNPLKLIGNAPQVLMAYTHDVES